ncbi:MAG: hypothetical protein RML37_10880 [Chitinophagales bacterium]|nr:hypothetical protein [Chitinophagales bacterium]
MLSLSYFYRRTSKTVRLLLINIGVLMLLPGCFTKVKINGYRETDFRKPERMFIITRAAKDEDLIEFQAKLAFQLQDYLVKKSIKSDYYVSKYHHEYVDSTGYLRLREFAPDVYIELGPTTDVSSISTSVAEAGLAGIAREGADYELIIRDYPAGKVLWRGKMSVSSILGAANGQRKTIRKIIQKFENDNLFQ